MSGVDASVSSFHVLGPDQKEPRSGVLRPPVLRVKASKALSALDPLILPANSSSDARAKHVATPFFLCALSISSSLLVYSVSCVRRARSDITACVNHEQGLMCASLIVLYAKAALLRLPPFALP